MKKSEIECLSVGEMETTLRVLALFQDVGCCGSHGGMLLEIISLISETRDCLTGKKSGGILNAPVSGLN